MISKSGTIQVLSATAFSVVCLMGVGAWSYAPAPDKKPWRPEAVPARVGMPEQALALPPGGPAKFVSLESLQPKTQQVPQAPAKRVQVAGR